jgi:hypothetical protein
LPPELLTVAVPELGVHIGGSTPLPLATPPPVVVIVTNPPAISQLAIDMEPMPVDVALTTQLVTNLDSASAVPPSEAEAVALPVAQFAVALPPVSAVADAGHCELIAVAKVSFPLAVALALPLGKLASASVVAPFDAVAVALPNMKSSADADPPDEALAVDFPPVSESTSQNVPSPRLFVLNPLPFETQVTLSPAIALIGAIAARVTAATTSVFFKCFKYFSPATSIRLVGLREICALGR